MRIQHAFKHSLWYVPYDKDSDSKPIVIFNNLDVDLYPFRVTNGGELRIINNSNYSVYTIYGACIQIR